MSEVTMNQDNTAIIMYRNDLLDGIFVDVDKDNYAFVSAHSEGYDDLADRLEEAGVPIFDFTEQEVDLSQPPHSWIVDAIGRLIISSVEK